MSVVFWIRFGKLFVKLKFGYFIYIGEIEGMFFNFLFVKMFLEKSIIINKNK